MKWLEDDEWNVLTFLSLLQARMLCFSHMMIGSVLCICFTTYAMSEIEDNLMIFYWEIHDS